MNPQAERVAELGFCDTADSTLFHRLSTNMDNNRDTVLHECLHAIEDLADIELEERQIRLMATCLTGMLRDGRNRNFWCWMLSEDS